MKLSIPSRPKLQYIEAKDDARKFAVVPYRACIDDKLSRVDLVTLILLCGYSNKNGYGFVALSTLAKKRGVSPQSISKAIKRLEAKGYVETVRKGYTNLRGALRRILYEPKLSERDQVAISNDNIVEVYDMSKHEQVTPALKEYHQAKRKGKPVKSSKVDNSLVSYDDAVLVVSHFLKSESDLLKLERLVSAGITRSALLAAFS